jgi:hypothetical protein
VLAGGDSADAVLGSTAGQVTLGDEIKQVLLLDVELGKPRLTLALRRSRGVLHVVEGSVEVVPDHFDEFGR